ncbi:hypothetical protein EMIHUDRAFT_215327 [Emiliania huxleyi CCMP1516]|uniref:N-acetyltransferase domain-containing protein n=2 Tax=Emiliania huxleyi TaxID=2903 RepID=A0A0D3IH74_EMIH1|nr:hypothetical protein EMIHUDRAFT_215327 [Emiliania huxleyi CCMP1516]EOD10609.1 hypothetical protein EMIHUDRAFT_215327 [Emiliania huxleyi CCMP1516]|eukprot:XP_005763038.1 hypothetical protein EMIHUDRAFT_215327 [Emiliania huxleyi CCMP1516]
MATVRLHPDAVSFMAVCGDLLLSHVAMNQHLLSNAHNTSLDSTSRLLFSVLDGNDQVVAAVVVAQVMNRQSFVAANIAGALSPDAAKAVVQSAREENASLVSRVSMSMGGPASRQAFASAFLDAFPGVTATPGLSAIAMELRGDCALASAAPGGTLQRVVSGGDSTAGALTTDLCVCSSALLDCLAAWNVEFARDALGSVSAPPSLDECRETLREGPLSRGDLYVWHVEGEGVVSMACVGRRLLEIGVSLSLVYTPPERRCNGYAGQLLAAMCSALSAQGKRVFLLADASSRFGTVRLYERLGFSNDGEYGDIRFTREAQA